MADIKQAIEYAKKNPNSAFATELRRRIQSGQMNMELKSAGLKTFGEEPQTKEGGFVDRVKEDIKETASNVGQAIKGEGEYENQSPTRRGVEAVAEVAHTPFKVAKEALPEPIREGVDKAMEGVGKGINWLADKIGDSKKLQEWVTNNPEAAAKLEDVLGTGAAAGSIAGDILGAEAGVRAGTKIGQGTSKAATATADATKAVVDTTKGVMEKGKDWVMKKLSPDVDQNIKNILKETPPEKFDEFVKVGEQAANDIRNPSLFDKVGDEMADAARQMKQRASSIGAQKSAIMNRAKYGLQEFAEPTRKAILEVRKLGENNPTVKSIIERLKTVKTKLDADKVIDEIQDKLYTASRDMTFPKGSAIEKQLRAILRNYNNALKEGMPKAYRQLNAEYSNLTKALGSINTSLGEAVQGVSTRGGSLVKQFFSPAGRKARVLFDYVKKKTGVDLAQSATMAKYIMEAFDDPRARSLLEGIPTSKAGIVDRLVTGAAEKVGGNWFKGNVRKGKFEKARDLMKKK